MSLEVLKEYNALIAEDVNIEKEHIISRVELRINECPEIVLRHTMNYIKSIRGNIIKRAELVSRLRNKGCNNVEASRIIEELKELDHSDNLWCDVFEAAIDELS